MSSPSGIVTFLTDFGSRDPFAGVMKGAVLGRFPGATLVDLTHEIEPGRIADAAFWLGNAYRWFPSGSVHVAVVDPGVGTARAPIALAADDHFFVGPDNGIFELVERRAPSFECRRIDVEGLGWREPSRTFHGRDVFAPAAALLAARALDFAALGPPHEPMPTQRIPAARRTEQVVEGEVVVTDRFGNLVTNVEATWLGAGRELRVEVNGRTLPLVGTYGDVAPGECAAVIGSFGQLELVQHGGSAVSALGAQRGTPLRVHGVG